MTQWLQFFKVLNKKEIIAFAGLAIVFFASLIFLIHSFYVNHTNIVPADSGKLREGILGQPQFINPLYAYSSDVDRDLIELVFSGLMKYDSNANIVPDLIKDYRVADNGKSIEFSLKENAKWHDGEPLTIEDVIFTVNLVQDSDYLSPLRANWQGVELEKTSEYKGIFRLKQPYSGFLENLANLKIMPKHIWQGATVQAMTSNTELNLLAPIGSGPYKVSKTSQRSDKTVKSITLIANKNYYDSAPHIQKLELIFFNKEEDLINSLKKGAIDSASIENSGSIDIAQFKNSEARILKTTNYFSVFLNNNKDPFKNKNIRTALTMGTDKTELLQTALGGKGTVIDSPIIPAFYGFGEPQNTISYNIDEANKLLEQNGFELKDGLRQKVIEKTSAFKFKATLQSGSSGNDVKKLQECLAQDPNIYPSGEITGTFGADTKQAVILFQEKYKDEILTPSGLTKGNGRVGAGTIEVLNKVCFAVPDEAVYLSFKIKTGNHPALIAAANDLKAQWEKLGVRAEVVVLDNMEMKRVIRERDFDALLFGEKLGAIPDPLPYWHSSQVIDPGLNLSLYQNTDLDSLLEKQRSYYDFTNPDRTKTLEAIQNTLVADAPAIYLYAADEVYLTSKKLKGFDLEKIIDSSKRFTNITNWYLGEKRTWK